MIEFNAAVFRQQIPAYSNATIYPDALIEGYWDAAVCYISVDDYGDLEGGCRVRALNLMTAHLLFLSILAQAGQIATLEQSATIDRVSVSLTPPPIKTQFEWWLNTTPYGQQLLALLKIVGTGGYYIGGLPEGLAFKKIGGYV